MNHSHAMNPVLSFFHDGLKLPAFNFSTLQGKETGNGLQVVFYPVVDFLKQKFLFQILIF